MKKITLLVLAVWLFNILSLSAQTIPPTGGGAASVNPPASWVGATASTSNKTLYQGSATKPWKNGSIPAVPGQANATFLSLYSNNSVITETSTTITGLTAGWTYEFSYYVMTGSAQTPAGLTDFAYAAEIAVDNGPYFKQYDLSSANNVNFWIPGTQIFTALGSTAKLKFRTLGQTAKGSISNLSVTPGSFKVVCGINPQVALSKVTLYNKCFQPYVNLNDAFGGSVPQGWSLVWYNNNTHSGFIPIVDPTKVTSPGDYYAFFYNGSGCYNTDLSTAKVTVSVYPPLPGNGQVILNATSIVNECPVTATVDLTTAFTSPLPQGAVVKWFDNPTHSGAPVADPTHASVLVSQYYAFFYDTGNNCYNTNNSTAIVKVTKRPCLPVPLPIFANSEKVNDELSPAIAMYPNPASDEIQVTAADFNAISQIQMFDLKGLTVYQSKGKPTKTINVQHLIPGMYIVKVVQKNGSSSSYKVMVVK
ncbi:MAG: T9SS type A sorting domain-containing protein [Dyadobacter sp.]|uniref:T9SS type A sorting domain-containing protein n=1 Tax=Dyadobacter sp. TaxID=1914288 RepID=UPI003267DB9A